MKAFLQRAVLATVMLLATIMARAYDFEVDGICYNKISDTNVEVTYRSTEEATYSGNMVIPDSVNYSSKTYAVTSIGESAFNNCTSLTSIGLPNSITSIELAAFSSCTELTSITLPNSITSIGGSAFSGCTSLTSIELPNSLTSIKGFAFTGCTGLTSIELPSSVTSIGFGTFADCTGLTSIKLPDSVTLIDNCAFDGCSSLTAITLPNSVTSIGAAAFRRCSSLTSIELPDSITSIGADTFYNCSSLTSITLPNSVTSIGTNAFYHCSSLTSITLPNSLTSIGALAFSECSGLTSIELPNSLTSIVAGAFSYCSRLTSITLPDSLTSIGANAFRGCPKIESVIVLATEPPATPGYTFDSEIYSTSTLYVPIVAYDLYKTTPVWSNWAKIEAMPYKFEKNDIYYNIISESEVEVTNESLEGTGIVGDITIPSTVTYSSKTYTVSSIGESAFANCNGITSVDIPASVNNIGKLAFSNCSALTTVKVAYTEEGPAKVIAENEEVNDGTSIGESAFRGCPVLSTIYLGSPVASIGNSAFAACPKIESITVLATEPPTAQDDSFDSEIYSTSTLYVPVVAYDLYKTTPVWSNWATVNSIGGSGIADSFVESDVKVEATDGAITVSGAEGGVCRIFDLRGMEVANRSAISSNESFTVKNSELYIVQLTTKDGKNVSRKVMVK